MSDKSFSAGLARGLQMMAPQGDSRLDMAAKAMGLKQTKQQMDLAQAQEARAATAQNWAETEHGWKVKDRDIAQAEKKAAAALEALDLGDPSGVEAVTGLKITPSADGKSYTVTRQDGATRTETKDSLAAALSPYLGAGQLTARAERIRKARNDERELTDKEAKTAVAGRNAATAEKNANTQAGLLILNQDKFDESKIDAILNNVSTEPSLDSDGVRQMVVNPQLKTRISQRFKELKAANSTASTPQLAWQARMDVLKAEADENLRRGVITIKEYNAAMDRLQLERKSQQLPEGKTYPAARGLGSGSFNLSNAGILGGGFNDLGLK